MYRDCFGGGADFDSPANIAIYRGSVNNATLYATFPVDYLTKQRLIPDTPACVAKVPNICVEEAVYIFTENLPVSNQSYFVVYQRCCRNITISNILNPGDIGATFQIEITPAAQMVCNNSPTFNNFPPIIICKDFPLDFDHSASDPDGDQLVYRFCAPLQGGGPILAPTSALQSCFGAAPSPPCAPPYDEVPFILPAYSPSNPMGGSPVVNINSTTGLITGTPNLLGQFVVGVCVEEYRNGVLLSVVRRDFQFNVTDCSPTVLANISSDSIAGPQRFVVSSCGQNSVTFINQSVQQQFIESFRWSFDLNGTPYSDSTNWNATVNFPDTGSYNGALYLNPGTVCADTAYIAVNIFPAITADFSFVYDTCVAGPVDFTDLSFGDGGVNRWSWNFGVSGGSSMLQNPSYLYPIPGNHDVQLRVYDKNRCSAQKTKTINWFPVPPLIIIEPDKFIGCVPDSIFFNNLSTPIDSTYHIVWDFGDGTTQENVISPTHEYTQPGLYDVSVSITSPIGCYTTDTFPRLIRGEPAPIANFSYLPDTLLSNLNNEVQFTDLSFNAFRWNWMFDKFGTSTQQNPNFTFPDTGLVKVRLLVTHESGCKDSLTRYLDFVPDFRWFMPNAFTPNGDGQNDEFYGTGLLEGVTDFNMSIWNRWGENVFETQDPNTGWNGRDQNNGKLSPAGVYVYLVTFTSPRGKPLEFKGFATLIR
ncbi:MAG: gliding motility-associated C-terminal domain-containing protein [Lewinellaceae bacterium]|nr:gliding motility-associated C-terminal domain-containing protein [Lewinellaceae bacterium]